MKTKMRIGKRYSGGGGGAQTSESIPAWAQPYIKNVMGQAESSYGSGALSKVAGASGLQSDAFTQGAGAIKASTGAGMDTLADQQERLKQAATSGGYDTTALKDKAILGAGVKTAALGNQYGQSGALGSARQAVAQGTQNAATAAEFANIDKESAQTNFQNKMAAEQGLGSSVGAETGLATSAASGLANLGSQQRTIQQAQDDAQWQGLQRYASTVYGSPAKQSATSGGK